MRRISYGVAASLDGFIAGPQGEHDWITPDSGIDFAAIYNRFDTVLMGRRTYEVALTRPQVLEALRKKVVVVSTTLDPARHPGVSIVASHIPEAVSALKSQPGKDIWLMGGGVLFRSLLDAGLVDEVNLSIFPVLLGGGVPLLPEGRRSPLALKEAKSLPSGVLLLSYEVKKPGIAGQA
jgi:dihydrofolate reductase